MKEKKKLGLLGYVIIGLVFFFLLSGLAYLFYELYTDGYIFSFCVGIIILFFYLLKYLGVSMTWMEISFFGAKLGLGSYTIIFLIYDYLYHSFEDDPGFTILFITIIIVGFISMLYQEYKDKSNYKK